MQKKYKVLFLSILLDLIGMVTYFVPFIGEIGDVVWAPLSAYLMYKIYKGVEGKIGSIITFIEEAGVFGTDLLPTFTIMWFYKYLIKKEN